MLPIGKDETAMDKKNMSNGSNPPQDLTEQLIENDYQETEASENSSDQTPETVSVSAKNKSTSPKKAKKKSSPIPAEENTMAAEEDLDQAVQDAEEYFSEEDILQRKEPVSKDPFAEPRRKHRRHWYGIPVGVLVLCFSIVGVIYLGQQTWHFIYSAMTDDSKARNYDAFIATVVMMDPAPFENISAAENQTILQTAIWQTVFNEVSTSQNYDEHARLIISADDVSETAISLFGVGCILEPMDIPLTNTGISTEGDSLESTISYDPETNSYHVPLVGTVGSYQPYTVSISSRGTVDTLRVAYCVAMDSSSNTSQLSEEIEIVGDNLIVVKYMEYEISIDKDLNAPYISAIRNVE